MHVHNLIGAFFKSKYVRILTAYSCLLTAISIVVSSILAWLQYYGYLTDIDSIFIIGRNIFGNGYLSLIYLGQIIFMKNLCSWSKLSWYILLVYYLVFALCKGAGGILSIEALTMLIISFIFLIIFIVVNLFEVKFKALEN